ncbi:MAG TPA: pirin family protein [Burkholderiales bacterium]|nr:pirin family protein [Burkholderiales bacterium]
MLQTSTALREVKLIAPAHKAQPAPGLIVDRPFPGPALDHLDPFLMLDHFGPEPIRPGEAGGLNPHPHRGFETVTIMLEGSMEHHDSQGNRGVIRPGGVQWMTAARGIVHAEYRGQELVQRGGTLHGVQLWVNLPRRFKMNPPGYQDLDPERIAEVPVSGGAVRAIAGEYGGVAGPARTFTPLAVLHLRLDTAGKAGIPVAAQWNAGAYLIRGAVRVNGRPLREREMAVFAQAEGDIEVAADAPSDVLVLAGQPIAEPVVSWGPFVMNTREEIVAAQRDYALGRMGSLPERV